MRLLLDRRTWDEGGGCRLIHTKTEWVESYIVAWAVIDLGFRAFVSPPLIVGRLGAKSSWKWKGWKLLGGKDAAEKTGQPGDTPEDDIPEEGIPETGQAEEESQEDLEGRENE